jgi:glycosyltransferase involved in cell wall biosynthesis
MKILHLVAGSLGGGAARGAYWLHQAQRELGIDSTILTNAKDNLGDASVISLAQTPLKKLMFALLPRLGILPVKLYRKRKPVIFNTGFEGVDFTKHPAYKAADIVHLHWINGLVSMRTLRKVGKPIVWTMRDMWPLTGGCHYSIDCERYSIGCGQCPQLNSQRVHDLSRLIVANKRASFPKHLRAIGISHWLSECATKSFVFEGLEVETISNNVNTSDFFPIKKSTARNAIGVKSDKKLILVGAQNISDFYKGFRLFVEALKFLNTEPLHFLFFGKASDAELSQLNVEYTNLGFLSDTLSLRLAYSAANVFVAPSRMDAFGKTLAEAMACGTPVVCFDATGPKDIVEHKTTGYKAEPFEPESLAMGIQWVLDCSPDDYARLCTCARDRVASHFDSRVIAKQYLALYQRLLNQ